MYSVAKKPQEYNSEFLSWIESLEPSILDSYPQYSGMTLIDAFFKDSDSTLFDPSKGFVENNDNEIVYESEETYNTALLGEKISGTGVIKRTSGSAIITGTNTKFLSECEINSILCDSNGTYLSIVKSIESDTSLTCYRPLTLLGPSKFSEKFSVIKSVSLSQYLNARHSLEIKPI